VLTLLEQGGATSPSISGLSSGTYTVTVTDSLVNSCQQASSWTLSQPPALSVLVSSTPVLCFGNSTGTVSAQGVGGTPPYSYRWNTGATTATLTNVPAGVYSVVATDRNACTAQSSQAVVQQPASALFITLSPTDSHGDDGSIISVVQGGTAPYTYLWSNGATTSNIYNLAPGTYSVVVTDSVGCSAVASAVIRSILAPTILCPPPSVQQCPANFSTSVTGTPTVGGCSGPVGLAYSDAVTPGCGNTKTINRTWVSSCGGLTCTQALQEIDTIAPTIAPVIPGGLANVTVPCLSEVPSVGVPPVQASDNCEGPNELVGCGCCHLCPQSNLRPCCDCVSPTQIRFALIPIPCSASVNSDEQCVEDNFPLDAEEYKVTVYDWSNSSLVYFQGLLHAGLAFDVSAVKPFSKLGYLIQAVDLNTNCNAECLAANGGTVPFAGSQSGQIVVNCKYFKRDEAYGSLVVQGMFPGVPCPFEVPCWCCSLCGSTPQKRTVPRRPKCIGRVCVPGSGTGTQGGCCGGTSCHPLGGV
jgi:hypothetical protein